MTVRFLVFMGWCLLVTSVRADVFRGSVSGVVEGDMLLVTTESGVERIVRLADIDSPDRYQPFANESRQALADLALGKQVTVESLYVDPHERYIGTVQIGDVSVGEQLVAHGLAWHFTKQSDSEALSQAQIDAQKQGLNIWSAQFPIAPWDYRRSRREQTVFSVREYLEMRDALPDPYELVGVDENVETSDTQGGSVAVPTGWLSRPAGGAVRKSTTTKSSSTKSGNANKSAAKTPTRTRASSSRSSPAYRREGS